MTKMFRKEENREKRLPLGTQQMKTIFRFSFLRSKHQRPWPPSLCVRAGPVSEATWGALCGPQMHLGEGRGGQGDTGGLRSSLSCWGPERPRELLLYRQTWATRAVCAYFTVSKNQMAEPAGLEKTGRGAVSAGPLV